MSFADNQTRVLSFFDSSGALIGQPIGLQNAYLPSGVPVSMSAALSGPETSPRTFAWHVEFEREVRRNVGLRLGYLDNLTTGLFVLDPVLSATGVDGLLAPLSGPLFLYHAQSESPAVWLSRNSRLAANSLAIGFPYSNVDVLQNYVGVPDSSRFPTYFSLDARVYREFALHVPFRERSKARKIRLGIYSTDVTNHQNPHDIFSNVSSPIFGTFAGFQRRIDGMVLDLVQ